jgi:hypothetical protein
MTGRGWSRALANPIPSDVRKEHQRGDDRMFKRALKTGIALFAGALLGCEGLPAELGSDETTEQEITMAPGSTKVIGREPTTPTGRYPEVVNFAVGCTGTILAPYLVLTARHCWGTNLWVEWPGADPILKYTVAGNVLNPYDEVGTFRPAWWQTMHAFDTTTLFVPTLSASEIHSRGILLPDVDAWAWAKQAEQASTGNQAAPQRMAVGTASFGPFDRDWAPVLYKPVSPEDTMYHLDPQPNFATIDGGDSGGPNFSSVCSDCDYEGRRAVIATNKSQISVVPFMYEPGVPNSAQQRREVRNNTLWLASRVSDPDGDGLPDECDSNRTSFSTNDGTRCPGLIGGPFGPSSGLTTDGNTSTFFYRTVADGRLACKPGYVAIGIRGNTGFEIRDVAVHCRAITCLGTTCSDQNQRTGDYWTDRFGAETDAGPSAPFDLSCPWGQVMTGLHGTHTAGDVIRSLGIKCSTTTEAIQGVSNFSSPLVGKTDWGNSFNSQCPTSRFLSGFHGRSSDTQVRWITGLQPVCTLHPARFTGKVGGTGGRGEYLACPEGYVARNTVMTTDSGGIKHFALGCAKQGSDTIRYYLSGGYHENATGKRFFSEVRGGQFRYVKPAGAITKTCPAGSDLKSIEFTSDLTVRSVRKLVCRKRSDGTSVNVAVNVGQTATGAVKSSACTQTVDGMFVRAELATHMVRLHCK